MSLQGACPLFDQHNKVASCSFRAKPKLCC